MPEMETKNATNLNPTVRGNWLSNTLFPAIIVFALAKLFGLIGVAIAFGVFFLLKDRIGSIVASIVALVASVAGSLVVEASLMSH